MHTTLRNAPQPAPGVLVRYYIGGPYRYARLVQALPCGKWQAVLVGRMHRCQGWRPSAPLPRVLVAYAGPSCGSVAHWRTCTPVGA